MSTKINIFDLCRNISNEESSVGGPLQGETTTKEVDSNSVSIKALVNDAIEQADGETGTDGSDEVVVENDNDNQLATSMEEMEAELGGQDLIDQVDETEEVFQDLDQTENAIASVEAYLDLLKGMERKGFEVSKETARAIQIGLEAYSVDYGKDIVSIEEAGDENSAKASINKLIARLKRLFEIAKRIAIKAVEAALNTWTFVTQNTTKLRERLKEVEGTVSSSEEKSFNVKLSKMDSMHLLVKGPQLASDIALANESASFFYKELPELIRNIANEAKEHLTAEGVENVEDSDAEKIRKVIMTKLDRSGWLRDGDDGDYISEPLFNNFRVKISVPKLGKVAEWLRSFGLGNGLIKITFDNDDGSEYAEAGNVDSVVSKGQLLSYGKSLHKLLDILEEGVEMRKTALEVQKEFKKDAASSGLPSSEVLMAKAKANLMKDAIRANVQLTGFFFRTVKSGIALMYGVSKSGDQPKAKEA